MPNRDLLTPLVSGLLEQSTMEARNKNTALGFIFPAVLLEKIHRSFKYSILGQRQTPACLQSQDVYIKCSDTEISLEKKKVNKLSL